MRPIYARPLEEAEKAVLQRELKSAVGQVVRRSQMILLSAEEGLKIAVISARLGVSGETVRRVVVAFNTQGVAILYPRAQGRKDDQRAFDDVAREQLVALAHRTPRDFGYATSLWTLDLLAEESYRQGLVTRRVHLDTISETLRQMGIARVLTRPMRSKKTPRLAEGSRCGAGLVCDR